MLRDEAVLLDLAKAIRLVREFTVDFDEVWRVVERDIPRLAEQIEPLLPLKGS